MHKPDIPGLPRYAKRAVDQQFARWVMLHVETSRNLGEEGII